MKLLALHLHSIMEYARWKGVSFSVMTQLMQHPPHDFFAEAAVVSEEDFYAVLEYVVKNNDDDSLGIHLGKFLNLNALGLIYRISLQAATVEEALHYLQTYLNTTFPIIEIKTAVNETSAVIQLNINNNKSLLNRIILEYALTVMSRELSMMTAEQAQIRLYSPYYQVDYPSPWNHDLSFSLDFTATILKATLQDKSRLQLDILIPEYLKLLESLKAEQSFSNKVKIASLHMARPELPDLEMIADAFHLTPRTLQRRLGDENVTFRQLTDDLKRQISALLIRHDRFSVSDISYVLGYSEPAAFIHCFKKWHGDSPERVRKSFSGGWNK
ncbi:helix-turn-helix domain-containing protein [Runella sp.]|uniref:helix-turn-helix domain-containing protein n=1 Tax=Runella sp. TaxID=1960881 RepID=UPI003D0F3028